MTRTRPDPHHAVTLEGEPARSLADRLLADAAERWGEGIDEAWADILDRSGASNVGDGRLGHDWDPASGRLTFVSRFSTSA